MTASRPPVSWQVDSDSQQVSGWSSVRLPFEPKDELLAYRTQLRLAIRALTPVAGAGLVADYAGPHRSNVDLENVALFNIGAGAFGKLTTHGLVCRRLPSSDDLHRLHYSVGDLSEPESLGTEILAIIDGVPIPLSTAKPGPWWFAIQPAVRVTRLKYTGEFLLDVTIGGAWTGTAVPNTVKPMLDGVVSALHRHDGSSKDALLPLLSGLGDPSLVWSQLLDTANALLGERTLVRPYRSGTYWNPADDHCSGFRIRVVPESGRQLSAVVLAAP